MEGGRIIHVRALLARRSVLKPVRKGLICENVFWFT
jgi:hypothetical protein